VPDPDIRAELRALRTDVEALRREVEMLTGQRDAPGDSPPRNTRTAW